MTQNDPTGDFDRGSAPIDGRLKAILIGAPIVFVAALLYQYAQIRNVEEGPLELRPQPSPAMERALSADTATEEAAPIERHL